MQAHKKSPADTCRAFLVKKVNLLLNRDADRNQ